MGETINLICASLSKKRRESGQRPIEAMCKGSCAQAPSNLMLIAACHNAPISVTYAFPYIPPTAYGNPCNSILLILSDSTYRHSFHGVLLEDSGLMRVVRTLSFHDLYTPMQSI
jgi:hypothetical protein